jgi:protease-4
MTFNKILQDEPMKSISTSDPAPLVDHGPVKPICVEGPPKGPHVAVIDVDGLLLNTDFTGAYSVGENPVAFFNEKLDAAAHDPEAVAVVLRINSPGGSVNAADLMHRQLLNFRLHTKKPVVACLVGMGAGGAYFLASAADVIVADPTTVSGAIGVILNLYNLREALGQLNVALQPIKAGQLADIGAQTHNLTREERGILETMAREFHQYMIGEICNIRKGVNPADGTDFDGRVFTTSQALERKLIDRMGYLDDAVQTARELAGCATASVALYRRCNDVARSIYAITPNVPMQGTGLLPMSIPGIDRTKLPTFLSAWLAEPTVDRLSGK